MSTKASKVKSAKSVSGISEERLREAMVARAPSEDLAAYDRGDIDHAVRLAADCLGAHKSGDSIVEIEPVSDIRHEGRAISTITVVNDNMPFLFDSVLGEIADSGGEPILVLHPVLLVRHDANGVNEVLGDASIKAVADAEKVSLIHVHLPRLSEEDCKALKERLCHILAQVRAAVTDWKPMLARLDQELTRLRYAPVPIEQAQLSEAIAFLEWLRDDNFTFLGMREFRYTGNEEEGTLERSDKKGLGILSDPKVLVLRRGTEARFHDAGNPRLPARTGAHHRHEGQCTLCRASAHLSRLCRREDLR